MRAETLMGYELMATAKSAAGTENDYIVEVTDLVIKYGSYTAVKGVSFKIRRGEFLTLLGAFRANTWVSFFAATGVILSAAYALWLYRRVMLGPLVKPELKSMFDLSRREATILVPLLVLTIFFGVYPKPVFNVTSASVDNLITNYQAALSAAGKLAVAVK